ncbi:MAG: hypothetical protein R3E66_04840 [bacterium]
MRYLLSILLLTSCGSDTAGKWDLNEPDSGSDVGLDSTQNDGGHDSGVECPLHPEAAFILDGTQNARARAGDIACANGRLYQVPNSTFFEPPVEIADNCCGLDIYDIDLQNFSVETVLYEHPNGYPHLPDGLSVDDECSAAIDPDNPGQPMGQNGCQPCTDSEIRWNFRIKGTVRNIGNQPDVVACDLVVFYPSIEGTHALRTIGGWTLQPGDTVDFDEILESKAFGCTMSVFAVCIGSHEPGLLVAPPRVADHPNQGQSDMSPPMPD